MDVRLVCVSTMLILCYIVFFFFKQKTAYEMRISDWSSDVCSSDLSSPRSRWPSKNLGRGVAKLPGLQYSYYCQEATPQGGSDVQVPRERGDDRDRKSVV